MKVYHDFFLVINNLIGGFMENKTIEIYSYEDNSQKTKISIKSLVTNKEISLKQIDIAHMNFLLKGSRQENSQ